MRMHRSPRSLAYNLDILSQLPDGLFAAKPCGALTDYGGNFISDRCAICYYPFNVEVVGGGDDNQTAKTLCVGWQMADE
jgi:hypothetical protein